MTKKEVKALRDYYEMCRQRFGVDESVQITAKQFALSEEALLAVFGFKPASVNE